MIPDFVMFFPISDYHFSHSLIGLFAYCLPMGMVIYYLWEWFGKEFAIALSPERIQYRINDYRRSKLRFGFIDILLTAIAIIIGSITHIVWDAFTHKGEWGVELIPWLTSKLEIASINIPGYKLFQYGSTFIGLPLLFCLSRWYLRNNQPNFPIETYSFNFFWQYAIETSFYVIPVEIAFFYWYQAASFKSIVGNTIKLSITTGIILFSIYGIIYKFFFYKLRKTSFLTFRTFYSDEPDMIFKFQGNSYRANKTASEIFDGKLPIKLPDGRFIKVTYWYIPDPPLPAEIMIILDSKKITEINEYDKYATAKLSSKNNATFPYSDDDSFSRLFRDR